MSLYVATTNALSLIIIEGFHNKIQQHIYTAFIILQMVLLDHLDVLGKQWILISGCYSNTKLKAVELLLTLFHGLCKR